MNSDLSERNREAFSSFSMSQDRLSLFLFLSLCLHRLSLDFIVSLYFYLCVLFNFNQLFFVIYNGKILNSGVALPTSIIYRFLTYTWHNFKWAFFLTWQHLEKGFCFYIQYQTSVQPAQCAGSFCELENNQLNILYLM